MIAPECAECAMDAFLTDRPRERTSWRDNSAPATDLSRSQDLHLREGVNPVNKPDQLGSTA